MAGNPGRNPAGGLTRIQATLRRAAEGVYEETLDGLKELTGRLDEAIGEKWDVEEFTELLESWLGVLRDVKFAEHECLRCYGGAEYDEKVQMAKRTMATYHPVKARALEYIDTLLNPATDPLVAEEELRHEVHCLGAQVQALTRSMSTTHMPPPPVRPAPVPQMEDQGEEPLSRTASTIQTQVQQQSSVSSTDESSLARVLSSALIANQRRERLPRIEPKVFKGDALDFPAWWASFHTFVDNECYTNEEKLQYLIQYTGGEVQSSILWYQSLMDQENSYAEAKAVIQERYGDKVLISDAFLNKLKQWPQIRDGEPRSLRQYSDFLWQCLAAMESIKYMDILNHKDENAKMARKLPGRLLDRWNRFVVDTMHPDREVRTESGEPDYPTFRRFCQFVAREARIANGPCAIQPSRERGQRTETQSHRRNVYSMNTQTGRAQTRRTHSPRPNVNSRPPAPRTQQPVGPRTTPGGQLSADRKPQVPKGTCLHCFKKHELSACQDFLSLRASVKKDFATHNDLCYGCLLPGHSYRECTGKNNSLLREPEAAETTKEATSMTTSLLAPRAITRMTTIVPVYVYIEGKTYPKPVYALIDSQSDTTFMSEDLMKRMGVSGPRVRYKLNTMHKKSWVNGNIVNRLMVQGINESKAVELPPCYTRPDIPHNRSAIPRKEELRKWPHMKQVVNEMPPYMENWDMDLLIGYDCLEAFRPRGCTPESDEGPFGWKSSLGWGVMGEREVPGQLEEEKEAIVHAASVRGVSMEEVRQVFDGDFAFGADMDRKVSMEDLKFLGMMERQVQRDETGRYCFPLPIRDRTKVLPDTSRVALKRLYCLKRRLDRDKKFRDQYVAFMAKLLANGHAEPVPPEAERPKNALYLPHQGVTHPRKPGEIRGVFDGSAETEGISLNSLLMTGPDLNNKLLGVLCRFRMNQIGFCCDIEKMFLQIRVALEDRDYLRFFWFPDGDTSKKPQEYRLTVHIFGASSSPAVATLAMRMLADDHADQFSPEVVDFLKKNFYVDNGLKSEDDVDVVVSQIEQSRALCQKGALNLRKYACSSQEVMDRLPDEIKADSLQDVEISGCSASQATLGLLWCLWQDAWRFSIKQQQQSMSRRGLLSTLSSIYDPLGLLAPVLLRGKNILQKICRGGYTWDELLPEPIVKEWNEWYADLGNIESLRVPRCYRKKVKKVEAVEYHVFADASSSSGYGACAYVVTRGGGEVDSALALAKAKVRPAKAVTVPRLELQAAVLAVKMLETLLQELPYENVKIFLWSDSQIVLAYIVSETLRFQIYVANRVQFIRDRTDPTSWRYIETGSNPANLASRGCSASELINSDLWWHGPLQMLNPPAAGIPYTVPTTDPELHRESRAMPTSTRTWSWYVGDEMMKIGDLDKIMTYTAIWQRYIKNVRRKVKGEPLVSYEGRPTVIERKEALLTLVRMEQEEELSETYSRLEGVRRPSTKGEGKKRRREAGPCAALTKLDPYLDSHGVMRIGGRLKLSSLPVATKHPVVLPPNSWLTTRIIERQHPRSAHPSVNHTLNATRAAGFWVLRGRRTVDRVLRQCVPCRKLRGPLLDQKMSDLPADRLQEAPPFTYCGVDMMGPVQVRNGRSEKKRWLALYTCLVTRAVHVEVCDTLSTDSFLSAYRRFVARRGPVRVLRSDQGTNILGARTELERAWAAMDHGQISKKIAEDGCDMEHFKPNTPRAPHMGGAWERLVGSVKRTLTALLMDHGTRLDDWSLMTFVAEAEAIVNSRPLTYVSDTDTDVPVALSPVRLLTLKGDHIPGPPGEFPREELYSRRQWRRAQYLSGQFWSRWRREYLPLVQGRSKWLKQRDNVRLGDVVLLQEDNTERSSWPLGRVVNRKLSEDGLVRSVTVKTRLGTYDRPIHRLVLVYRKTDDADADTAPGEATSA